MKKSLVASVVFGSVVCFSSVAFSAASEVVVGAMEGKVMVDSGKGFFATKLGTQLSEGDRVVALKGSNATLNFAQGCSLVLSENSLVTVSKEAACKAEIVAINQKADSSAVAALGDKDAEWPHAPFFIGGAAVVGGVAVGMSNGNKDAAPISGQ